MNELVNIEKLRKTAEDHQVGTNMHNRAKFRQNGQTVAEIWWFSGFQNGGRPQKYTLRPFVGYKEAAHHIT